MKPLNRPMFRYGGPIKEGVMSGIREPKKNGGLSKQFNTGLVGDERYPQTSGREHHWAFLPAMGMTALRLAARPFGQFVAKQVAKRGVTAGSGANTIRSGLGTSRVLKPGESLTTTKQVFNPNALGSYFARSPEAGLVKALVSGSGRIAGPLKKVAVGGAKSPLTVGGLLYMGGSYFYPDGTPAKEEDIKKAVANAGGKKDYGPYTPQAKGGGGAEMSAEERRAKNVERYRDIMDIKGMNKDAAYNSLIAASQAINQSGDFKGDIKSGKLINQIIQATSKQFDKPKQTKDAIDTLILKGEIEKDIKSSDPSNAVLNELRAGQLKKLNKDLKGNTTAEIIQARMLKDDMPSGSNLASLISINNPELNIKTLPTKDLGNADPIDYMTQIVATVNADETTPDYPAGVYVLKDKVIKITEEGSVIPVPINALK